VLPSQVETWGLVINEAMAAGVLPVVSDQVGAAPDLVEGVGEVYPCGDVPALAAALDRALARATLPETRAMVRKHVARYSLELTAVGFEQGAVAASSERRTRHQLRARRGAPPRGTGR
jgi:glycosyltransferase involved in cell wall biosynthesis